MEQWIFSEFSAVLAYGFKDSDSAFILYKSIIVISEAYFKECSNLNSFTTRHRGIQNLIVTLKSIPRLKITQSMTVALRKAENNLNLIVQFDNAYLHAHSHDGTTLRGRGWVH